jgi:hypothetical protein
LRAIGDPPLGLDGTITLYRSRFLHLDIDLSFDAGPEAAQNAQSATDRLVNGDDSGTLPPGEFIEDDVGLQPPLRYRIVEDRIMRDGEIRYFDHPRFGMLARVTREEASDATEAGDGPGQGDSRD